LVREETQKGEKIVTTFIDLGKFSVATVETHHRKGGKIWSSPDLKVTRKADGAELVLHSGEIELPGELLWMFVHGDKGLNKYALECIERFEVEAKGDWVKPKARERVPA
jgi:hypothetical protein